MLPPPTLSFMLPSLHDDTKLACRVYHPALLENRRDQQGAHAWRGNAAVVAHPYAIMGGCYDDRVVELVAGALVNAGYVVATFNFRGASPSGGRTSWTSRPEQADYMSVVGFLAHYTHYLLAGHDSSPSPKDTTFPEPTLLMAGYSYGAMITLKVPQLDKIMAQFTSPPVYTAAADIRLKAQHLAEQQNKLLSSPASPRKSLGMRIGGSTDEPRRKSHDILRRAHTMRVGSSGEMHRRKSHDRPRRSHSVDREERIRKGVVELLGRTKLIHHHYHHRRHHSEKNNSELDAEKKEQVQDKPADKCMQAIEGMTKFKSAHLVISPPYGIVTNLATMSLPNPFASWSGRKSSHSHKAAEKTSIEDHQLGNVSGHTTEVEDLKLTHSPTLAIYGDSDSFLTLRRIRDWSTRLAGLPGLTYHSIEVAGAGHFWIEDNVFYRLRDAVREFAKSLT